MRGALPLVLALLVGCTFHLKPAPTAFHPPASGTQSSREMLVLLPHDFTSFVHSAAFDVRDIRYEFGQAALAPFRDLVVAVFPSARFRELPGGPVALYAEIQRSRGEADYLAVPRFLENRSYVSFGRFHVELAIELELLPTDTLRPISVRGSGAGTAGWYFAGPLKSAGSKALAEALSSLSQELSALAPSLAWAPPNPNSK